MWRTLSESILPLSVLHLIGEGGGRGGGGGREGVCGGPCQSPSHRSQCCTL